MKYVLLWPLLFLWMLTVTLRVVVIGPVAYYALTVGNRTLFEKLDALIDWPIQLYREK